ncbi:M48 family metallopeptidase [Chroococcidiopsis sp. CCMEE 29]|uniref:M48 family metallopeptidase n=1 Tax=Chroococcidiopsis sp. CCMEE 29 TaxID=155894 RepID=UPI002020F997|nr:M48 family metallopeptidase [Chroococcidiopsis sp. CCMEE 29]
MFNLFSFFSRRHQHRWLYPLLSLIVAFGIFVGSLQPSQALPWFDLLIRGVQVIQLSNVSDKEEIQLGRQINQQLVSREFQLYRNESVNRYVDQIGQRLAARSDRSNIPYTFQVVNNKSVNAFATAGGFVYVTTGLMTTADNEAQLASVLAHEIGHISNRHLIQQMRQTAIAGGVATAAGVDRNRAVQIGVDLALRRPNSRQDEFEADQTGLRTLGRAGYAESAMVAFMEKLLKQGRSAPSFLSTHPATGDRITALRREIDPQKADGDGLNNAAYKANIRPLLS